MVSKFMQILDLLSDGKWHRIDELSVRVKLTEKTFREVTEFLDKYSIVEFNRKDQKVKIGKDFRKLLVEKTFA